MSRIQGLSRVLAAASIVAVTSVPAVASAANYTFCMFYHVDSDDSGVGEDYYTSAFYWKARGAKVRVRSVIWPFPVVFDDYANETNGCFIFTHSGTQFWVDLYAETQLGATGNISINAYPASSWTKTYWTIETSPGLTSGTYNMYGPASQLSNLIGVGTFAAYWYDSHSGTRISGPQSFNLHNEPCATGSTESCQVGDDLYISTASNERKFLIAHETGHALYLMHRDGEDWAANCDLNDDANCFTTGTTSHALHSEERQSCALSEGFAHFVSTDAFNSHGSENAIFHYYKSGYPDIVNVENGPTGGDTAYLEAVCEPSYAGRGVELDWLRTFWDYHTNGGTGPNHHQIMSQLSEMHDDPGYSSNNAYALMSAAADADGFLTGWEDAGEWNGIDH